MSAVDRASLEARLRAEGLESCSWSNRPGDRYEMAYLPAGTLGTGARGRGCRW